MPVPKDGKVQEGIVDSTVLQLGICGVLHKIDVLRVLSKPVFPFCQGHLFHSSKTSRPNYPLMGFPIHWPLSREPRGTVVPAGASTHHRMSMREGRFGYVPLW